LKSVFRKETYAGFREELVAVAEGKTRFQMEIVTQTTTGNSVNADFRWHIAPGHEKTYSKILISIVDITKLKQMENKLRENTEHLEKIVEKRTAELLGSQRRLHLLTDALPALISYVDSDQRYRFNNRAYEEWFQHSRQEITGRRINEVLGETAYQTIQRYVAEALSGKKVTYESTVPYKDGGQRYIYATYVPDFDEEGKVKGFYALVNDITERKQMEQTLRKAERYAAIGEAAAMVGHDLRNPLQVIINRLYLAKKVTRSLSYPYSDVAAKLGLDELFKELEDQTIYMNKIVSDLQDYSKPLKPELVETSLRQLVDNTFSMMQVPKNI
jgi:PAS domain S-box-containing protein